MPNLRIIYDNAADRATSLTASTTSGSLAATNLQNDKKSLVHRSTGTSVTYTLTWSTNQTVSAVVLPCTNLSATATVRVRLYSDVAGTTLLRDTGTKPASTTNNVTQLFGSLSVNTFQFGGFTKVVQWVQRATTCRRCVVDIVDTGNPAGFIDCSRLVVGDYWTPQFNFEPGVTYELVDNSDVERSESGDVRVEERYKHERLSFNFALLPESDMLAWSRIVQYVGTTKNLVVTLMPEYDALAAETQYLIYGRRRNTGISYSNYKYYKSNFEIESW